MKTALVTGAAGFIGSNLCLRLLKNYRVIGVDNLLSGQQKNIDDLLKYPNFRFTKKDIVKPLNIKDPIDEIWNLACPASPRSYQRYPIKTLLTCSQGVKNILDLAVKNKAKFLHTSTSEVYGDPTEHPQKESYWGYVNPIGERSCYDEGKRFAESLIINYHQKYGLETKIVRIFNTYGPRMRADDGRVVSNFIVQALLGENLTVYGKGKQTRSFCYIDELINGLIKMMASKNTGPINLGNPNEFTMLQLAKLVIQLTGFKSKIVYQPLPNDDPKQRCPDISLAKNLLNWQTKIDLKTGLQKTISYFQSCLK